VEAAESEFQMSVSKSMKLIALATIQSAAANTQNALLGTQKLLSEKRKKIDKFEQQVELTEFFRVKCPY